MSHASIDRAAWVREALARHERPLVAYAARIVGDLEGARDVVQHAFLKLCEADRAGVEPRVAEWLYTVCRHRALDARRERSRVAPMGAGESVPERNGSHEPIEAVERDETRSALLASLARLPERQQEVVRLKFEAGLSYRGIAEVTGISVGAVGSLLHGALQSLRRSPSARRLGGVVR